MTASGLTPSRRVHPPMMITNEGRAVTSSRKTTTARALFASGFSRFGRQSSYPGRIAPASMASKSMGWAGCALDPTMRAEGLEPPRSFEHQDLNLDRLPVPARPPGPQFYFQSFVLRMRAPQPGGRMPASTGAHVVPSDDGN